MNEFLVIAFLFFIGSLVGWVLELLFRRFISDANPKRKWINPGFLVGPYLPLYGFSLSALYIMAHINVDFIQNEIVRKIVLFCVMAIVITAIEFIAGMIFIKGMKIKLWDYTNEWCNIKGVICPKFTFYWVVLSAIYYFCIHQSIQHALHWLADHLAFSFVIGFFYGIFIIDLAYSMNIMARIRKFAIDNELEVKYEELKEIIRRRNEEYKSKVSFMFAMRSDHVSLSDNLKKYLEKYIESGENKIDKLKNIVADKVVDKVADKVADRTDRK